MEDNPPKLDSELESFRQQWRSELKSKKPAPEPRTSQSKKVVPSSSKHAAPPEISSVAGAKKSQVEEDEEYARSLSFDEPPPPASGEILEEVAPPKTKELVSALDHFEEAVEKEGIGNLGDSLTLYRKAFRVSMRSPQPGPNLPNIFLKAGQPCGFGIQKEALSRSCLEASTTLGVRRTARHFERRKAAGQDSAADNRRAYRKLLRAGRGRRSATRGG